MSHLISRVRVTTIFLNEFFRRNPLFNLKIDWPAGRVTAVCKCLKHVPGFGRFWTWHNGFIQDEMQLGGGGNLYYCVERVVRILTDVNCVRDEMCLIGFAQSCRTKKKKKMFNFPPREILIATVGDENTTRSIR